MKEEVKSIFELKDSRLLYEKDMPPFGYLTIIIVLVLIFGVVLWSMNANKEYIVRGSGIVECINKNYVMAPVNGEIKSIKIKEGDYVKQGDILFIMKSKELDIQSSQLSKQKIILQKQISQYDKLVRSIKNDENYFKDDNAEDEQYASQYEMYKTQQEQQKIDILSLQQYGYTQTQIEEEIKKNDAKKAELYYTAISQAEASKNEIKAEIEALNVQLNGIKKGKLGYRIKATTSGTVHMLDSYKEGMIIQEATPLASIGADMERYTVISYIDIADRPKISTGDAVELEVTGLSTALYGTIRGKIVQIDSDGKRYFRIAIMPKVSYLVSKDGNKINLSNGISVESRIVYNEVTYFDYFIELLNLK